jgi:hypothetical protein
MVELGRNQLAGTVGVKSLAPRDWHKVMGLGFLSDPRNVQDGNMASVGIYNYHRGIEWLWLNQFMLLGELQYGDTDHGYREYVAGQVRAALHKAGVGGLDELNDVHGPLGADFQAWSMSSFIAGLHHFAGVAVDAQARTVSVRPSVPSSWPELVSRQRVGSTRFDVHAANTSHHTQSVVIEPLDTVPAGYTLGVGVRLPSECATARMTVNGAPVAADEVDMRHTAGGLTPSEAWVTIPWSERVAVEVEAGR